MSDEISCKLQGIESRLAELAHDMDIVRFKEELFEILLIISTLKDKEKISFYLKFFERMIGVMKSKGLWEEVDTELMRDVMHGIAENWKEYKKEDLANLFEVWLGKNIIGGD